MHYSFPNDVAQQVQGFLATGQFDSEDDVLRGALQALDAQQANIRMIRQGLAEYEAGLGRPYDEFDAEICREFTR